MAFISLQSVFHSLWAWCGSEAVVHGLYARWIYLVCIRSFWTKDPGPLKGHRYTVLMILGLKLNAPAQLKSKLWKMADTEMLVTYQQGYSSRQVLK